MVATVIVGSLGSGCATGESAGPPVGSHHEAGPEGDAVASTDDSSASDATGAGGTAPGDEGAAGMNPQDDGSSPTDGSIDDGSTPSDGASVDDASTSDDA